MDARVRHPNVFARIAAACVRNDFDDDGGGSHDEAGKCCICWFFKSTTFMLVAHASIPPNL